MRGPHHITSTEVRQKRHSAAAASGAPWGPGNRLTEGRILYWRRSRGHSQLQGKSCFCGRSEFWRPRSGEKNDFWVQKGCLCAKLSAQVVEVKVLQTKQRRSCERNPIIIHYIDHRQVKGGHWAWVQGLSTSSPAHSHSLRSSIRHTLRPSVCMRVCVCACMQVCMCPLPDTSCVLNSAHLFGLFYPSSIHILPANLILSLLLPSTVAECVFLGAPYSASPSVITRVSHWVSQSVCNSGLRQNCVKML